MTLTAFLFYFFEVLAAVATVSMLLTRNVLYGALLLIVGLLSLAGIYVLAFAEFVAATQILIYAGGILVLIIFGIMLTSKIAGKPLRVENKHVLGGGLLGLLITFGLVMLIADHDFGFVKPVAENQNQVNQMGTLLMSDYLLPFEVAGVLLLIALVGASVISSSQLRKE